MESKCFSRITLAFLILAASAFFAPSLAQRSENVTQLGHLSISGANDVWGYSAPDGTELAIVGTNQSTVFVDVTEPTDPKTVAEISGQPSSWRDMKTYDHYAYSLNEGAGGLQVFDLENPLEPFLANTVESDFTRAHNLFIDVDAGVLYTVGTRQGSNSRGVLLYDVKSDPAHPSLITTWDDFYVHDIFARDGLAFCAAINDGKLVILDVSNLPAVEYLSDISYSGAATHNTWLTDDGKHCVTTDETAGGHLHVFNVEDPTAPYEVSQWTHPEEPGSSAHNATVLGDLAYTSWYSAGLQIIDVSEPAHPVRVGYYDTYPGLGLFVGNWGVYPFAESGNIYLSDRTQGLIVVQYDGERAHLTATVVDENTGRPLPDATVSFPDLHLTVTTGMDGQFSVRLPEGTHQMDASLFRYETTTTTFEFAAREQYDLVIPLQKKPVGEVEGILVDLSGAPAISINVRLEGTPLQSLTDDQGWFRFSSVPVGDYALSLERFGYLHEHSTVSVSVAETSELDVLLFEASVAENFENETGWIVGDPADTATDGLWERGDPNGTWEYIDENGFYAGPVQPGDDYSVNGTHAFVTGNGPEGLEIGAKDVDGGQTSLISPRYDLSQMDAPVLTYARWFRNDGGANPGLDPFRLDASSNDGDTWMNVETTYDSHAEWTKVEVALSDWIEPTDRVRFRFIATDDQGSSLVEAAIDDLEIFDLVSRVRGVLSGPNGPIEGGIIDFGLTAEVTETGAGGSFELLLPPGTYEIEARSFGYDPFSMTLDVAGREDLSVGMTLQSSQTGMVSGNVASAGASSIRQARVWLGGTPLETETGADGQFSLAAVPIGRYDLFFAKDGYETSQMEIEVGTKETTSLSLSLNSLFPTAIASIAPNPFRTEAVISLSLADEVHVDARIYDIQGREVRQLADEIYPAGEHQLRWNGRGEDGGALPGGVYFQKLRAGTVTERRRLLLLR